jgi:hypothetical protein
MPRSWHSSGSSGESSGSDEEDDEASALQVRLWLDSARRDTASWPLDQPPPTAIVADDDVQWGATASGVDIRMCDDASKGHGVFATRKFAEGAFVGIYQGEQLTQREYAIRHTGYEGATAEEQGVHKERRERIASLAAGPGVPAGGADNHGAYVFSLIPTTTTAVAKLIDGDADLDDEHVSCIDAEDPTRSSWCRYINHAQHEGRACNLVARVLSTRALVWFEAVRHVEIGEELCFSYGPEYTWQTV